MNLLKNKATLKDCCRLVLAARKHLGLEAKLVFDGDGEGHVDIDHFSVIPEIVAYDPKSQRTVPKRVDWQLSICIPSYGGYWDPPDCDFVELGDFSCWGNILVEIASFMAKERLDNLLDADAYSEALREAEHYERLISS